MNALAGLRRLALVRPHIPLADAQIERCADDHEIWIVAGRPPHSVLKKTRMFFPCYRSEGESHQLT